MGPNFCLMKQKDKEEVFQMPAWQDCTWRRVPCNKADCPMCGRVQRQRQKHIERGEDPDTWEAAMQDVGETFKEVHGLLRKDAKRMGIDLDNLEEVEIPEPPKAGTYPIYNKMMEWRKSVFSLAEEASEWGEAWLESEAGHDLTWYANLLPVKITRALSDKWEMENTDMDMEVDYDYTKYVIGECVKILQQALTTIRNLNPSQAVQFQLLHSQLVQMEEEIKSI